jgi:hypothetical protein
VKRQTPIPFSKRKTIGNILLLLVVPAVVAFLNFNTDAKGVGTFGWFVLIVFSPLILFNLWQLLTKKPALVISEDGIKICNRRRMYFWDEIKYEQIALEYHPRGTIYILKFYAVNGGDVQYPIDDLALSVEEVGNLLHTYRRGYSSKQQTKSRK